MMKVVTGSLRGRSILTLDGNATRPTTQRVKEAMFSAIQFDIEGRRVLDAFAGSGQLGIEAISRGASACVFVDKEREAADVVRRNVSTLGIGSVSTVLCQDSMSFLRNTKETFDLIFIDPPYGSGLQMQALELCVPLLNTGGIIVCETDEKAELPAVVGEMPLYRSYRYSHVKLWIYR